MKQTNRFLNFFNFSHLPKLVFFWLRNLDEFHRPQVIDFFSTAPCSRVVCYLNWYLSSLIFFSHRKITSSVPFVEKDNGPTSQGAKWKWISTVKDQTIEWYWILPHFEPPKSIALPSVVAWRQTVWHLPNSSRWRACRNRMQWGIGSDLLARSMFFVFDLFYQYFLLFLRMHY